eukprot:CAMPEP_0113709550 /NCGR_PEP_ID=MMETSP0038_2-20120614/29634_1 /TAXON_ID=2898 /ORGANISM="Cryptomonas paramecium" /LENGTH=164 /DNA_ID=CAMNT_0000635449 /DNA_START=66 /DNA_END=556 /DNA_ORIENTATION=+ /assembly_acc=CAM_ASM_000170
MRVIGAACRASEITEDGITHIEKLELARQPIPDMEAVYLISPTSESIKLLCADWKAQPIPEETDKKKKPKNKQPPGQKPPEVGLYAAAHVYVISPISEEVMFAMKQSPVLLKKIKTFKLLHLEFLASESQGFTLDMDDALARLYAPDSLDSGDKAACEAAVAAR